MGEITPGTRVRWGDVLEEYETGVVVEVLESPITGRPRAFVVRPDRTEPESARFTTIAIIVNANDVACNL